MLTFKFCILCQCMVTLFLDRPFTWYLTSLFTFSSVSCVLLAVLLQLENIFYLINTLKRGFVSVVKL